MEVVPEPEGEPFTSALTAEQIQSLPDDPAELAQVLEQMIGEGLDIRVNGFSGGELPPGGRNPGSADPMGRRGQRPRRRSTGRDSDAARQRWMAESGQLRPARRTSQRAQCVFWSARHRTDAAIRLDDQRSARAEQNRYLADRRSLGKLRTASGPRSETGRRLFSAGAAALHAHSASPSKSSMPSIPARSCAGTFA